MKKIPRESAERDMQMNNKLFEEAKCSDILSRELVDTLLESMEYNVFSFINWSIDVLRIIKTRIERGDKITDEVSGVVYTKSSLDRKSVV